ncbi:MAG: hypothetical protein E6Q76_02170 [Rhizobium sp.]|nr:MAG: hypothetical protein E6Q76_02170 [Rhizobium sp.]
MPRAKQAPAVLPLPERLRQMAADMTLPEWMRQHCRNLLAGEFLTSAEVEQRRAERKRKREEGVTK